MPSHNHGVSFFSPPAQMVEEVEARPGVTAKEQPLSPLPCDPRLLCPRSSPFSFYTSCFWDKDSTAEFLGIIAYNPSVPWGCIRVRWHGISSSKKWMFEDLLLPLSLPLSTGCCRWNPALQAQPFCLLFPTPRDLDLNFLIAPLCNLNAISALYIAWVSLTWNAWDQECFTFWSFTAFGLSA